MRNIFYKKIKLISLGDYVTYLKRSKLKKFQLDIFRNNLTDLQLIYNEMDYGISILKFDKNKVNIILSFTDDLKERERCFENFKKSSLFDKAIFFQNKEFNNRYIIEIEKNWDVIYDAMFFIMYKIYEYSEKDIYSVGFLDFSSGNANLINHTFISWFEYYFKRK